MVIEDHISHQIGTVMTTRPPEDSMHRERHRYEVSDRRYRHDSYTGRSDSGYNNQLTSSQCLEVKLFLDKISYFDGSNNKEALNFLAQCEEAVEKMKASEVTIAWSKLAGQADRIMREQTRQHEGSLTWDLFQSTLIEHFYHIPSKERAASLLNKLQQDPHKNIGEYMQRSNKIIQVHPGKTNLKEIATSQYGWNLVQGLTNIPIKNKIADRISLCQSLSDVCKLVKSREKWKTEKLLWASQWKLKRVQKKSTGDSTTTTKEEEVIIEVAIEVTTIKQTTVLEGEVTKMVIIMVMVIQDNRQVTAVRYIR